jgi:plasmid stabilization system protein ParE
VAQPSVEFHPNATAEARAAFLWYFERNPVAASAFIAELDHAVSAIRSGPERWPRHLHGTRKIYFSAFLLRRDLPSG